MSHQVIRLSERIQEADWQKEKHVPVIEAADGAKAGGWMQVKVSLGKRIKHPNTTEHHIRWLKCYFSPDDEKSTYEVGRFEFSAHGESAEGPNKGPVYTSPQVIFSFKVTKPGTLHAIALCNIHGLWESQKRIELV
jgi:superoxide reductase